MSFHLLQGDAHPWASARDEWESTVLPRLERDGKAIGTAAYNGNKAALKVIESYQLLHRSFDPVSLTSLKEALKEYDETAKSPRPE